MIFIERIIQNNLTFAITKQAYDAVSKALDDHPLSPKGCLHMIARNFHQTVNLKDINIPENQNQALPIWDYKPGGVPLQIIVFKKNPDTCVAIVHEDEIEPKANDGQNRLYTLE